MSTKVLVQTILCLLIAPSAWAADPNRPLIDTSNFAAGFTTRTISSSNTKAAAIYAAPKSGNIRWIGLSCSSVSGALTVLLGIETVSSRLPTGTLVNVGASANYSPAGANTFVWTQLGTDAAVTQGQLFAATVNYVSGTSATVRYAITSGRAFTAPYTAVASAGTYAAAAEPPAICVKYSDGTFVYGGMPAANTATANYASNSNPNEYAVVFTPSSNCTLLGCTSCFDVNTDGAQYSLNLYTGTSTTPTATFTAPAAYDPTNGGAGKLRSDMFPTPVVLTAGQQYRLSILSLVASKNIELFRWTFSTTADRDYVMCGVTSDTRNGGAWIGEGTLTTALISPIIGTATLSSGSGPKIVRGTGLQP
jgi:hypothetical protein